MELPKIISKTRARGYLAPALWALGTATACGAFLAFAEAPHGSRGLAAACAAALLLSLVLPALAVSFALPPGRGGPGAGEPADEIGGRGHRAGGALPLGRGVAGSALGLLAFSLVAARAGTVAALESVIVVAAAALSFGALARALAKAMRRPLAGGCVAGAALLAATAMPFWSRPLFMTSAGGSWGRWLVGASPFLAAALPWTGASESWSFDPRTSVVLYNRWIGTDVPLLYPSWVSCAAGHLVAAALLVGLAELPRVIRSRRGA